MFKNNSAGGVSDNICIKAVSVSSNSKECATAMQIYIRGDMKLTLEL